MKKLIFLFIVSLISFASIAGNGDVTKDGDTKLVIGKVIDKKTGEEIVGAEIKINDKVIYTDLNGNFSASVNANTPRAEALITFISYNDTKVNIDAFSYNTVVVELELK
jgi:hypothetical protein